MSTTDSKYIYKTVYEEFTGLKPPEPKNAKPKRRRGYGHPYRMRLNMQDETRPEETAANSEVNIQQPEPDTFNDTSYLTQKFKKEFRDNARDNYRRDFNRQPRNDYTARPVEMAAPAPRAAKEGPKVTYRKRRHTMDDNPVSEPKTSVS
ncbi:hypothetical protein [Spongorhabdus nitratireducens]